MVKSSVCEGANILACVQWKTKNKLSRNSLKNCNRLAVEKKNKFLQRKEEKKIEKMWGSMSQFTVTRKPWPQQLKIINQSRDVSMYNIIITDIVY